MKKGDIVFAQPYATHKHWQSAVVLEKFQNRRYKIRLENGRVLYRNRRHLRLRGARDIMHAGGRNSQHTESSNFPEGADDAYGGGDEYNSNEVIPNRGSENETSSESESNTDDRDDGLENEFQTDQNDIDNDMEESQPIIRRSARDRKVPERFGDYRVHQVDFG